MAPCTISRKREITDTYEKLIQKGVESTTLREWSVEVEITLLQAQELDLGFLMDTKPFMDVLKCLRHLDPGWTGYWTARLSVVAWENRKTKDYSELPSAVELLRQFRDIYTQKKPSSKGTFATSTLQSEEAPSGSRNKTGTPRKKCLDGKPGHNEAGCYHLHPEKRPEG